MNYKSWLSNTVSQPLQMIVDINYVQDCRGKNYSIFTSEKVEIINEPLFIWEKDVFLTPQFVMGNFSIHSPPRVFYNSNSPLIPRFFMATNYSYRIVVT